MPAEPIEALEKPNIKIPAKLPILPIRGSVVFPFMVIPLSIERRKNIRLIEKVYAGNKLIGMFSQRDPEIMNPSGEELYSMGVAGMVMRKLVMPDDTLRVIVQGISRIRLEKILRETPYLLGQVDEIKEDYEEDAEIKALVQNTTNLFQRLSSLSDQIPEEMYVMALNLEEPDRLADFIASNIYLSVKEKQELLETLDLKERLKQLTVYLNSQIMLSELGSRLQEQALEEIKHSQKEYFLRHQLRAIQNELGELDEKTSEEAEFLKKIKKAKMPKEVEKEAMRELSRFKQIPQSAADYTVTRTYLDWLVHLPWTKQTKDKLDINKAQSVLDNDHYNLEQVKERILEYLAVRKLKADLKSPIICLVGPPGVGKTSLGMSIARAMGRKFHRISLGGMRDEAEIRGHRRTYVGALPGRILQGLRRVGYKNPVFMLDELDKIGADFRGDPSAALLEALDPEQNYAFSDHYIEHPFDLSQVLFITTANILDTIPPALKDRLEVIRIPGYVNVEKQEIAKKHLIPKQVKSHGLKKNQLSFQDKSLPTIISNYTREAGVRQLEREVASICRKAAKLIALGEKKRVTITPKTVKEYLGIPRFLEENARKQPEIGVSTGLAWTAAGGELLFIEAETVRGKKGLQLTGQLGEVMKESCQAALTYIRSIAEELDIKEDFYEDKDIHIHVPAGATPKDGPSAGICIAVSLASILTGRPVRSDVAMTGEITLRGKVMPVGAIKEKVLAAKLAGIEEVILPADNEKDLEDIPQQYQEGMTFHFVKWIREGIELAVMKDK